MPLLQSVPCTAMSLRHPTPSSPLMLSMLNMQLLFEWHQCGVPPYLTRLHTSDTDAIRDVTAVGANVAKPIGRTYGFGGSTAEKEVIPIAAPIAPPRPPNAVLPVISHVEDIGIKVNLHDHGNGNGANYQQVDVPEDDFTEMIQNDEHHNDNGVDSDGDDDDQNINHLHYDGNDEDPMNDIDNHDTTSVTVPYDDWSENDIIQHQQQHDDGSLPE
jgi:hypothetical protein